MRIPKGVLPQIPLTQALTVYWDGSFLLWTVCIKNRTLGHVSVRNLLPPWATLDLFMFRLHSSLLLWDISPAWSLHPVWRLPKSSYVIATRILCGETIGQLPEPPPAEFIKGYFSSMDFYVYPLVCSISSVINHHTLNLPSLTTPGSCLLGHYKRRPLRELPIGLTSYLASLEIFWH